MDEVEAIRLADLGGLYQEQAAEKMNVSLGRPLGELSNLPTRRSQKLWFNGKALKIEGGEFEMASMRKFRCQDCQHAWDLPFGTGRPG